MRITGRIIDGDIIDCVGRFRLLRAHRRAAAALEIFPDPACESKTVSHDCEAIGLNSPGLPLLGDAELGSAILLTELDNPNSFCFLAVAPRARPRLVKNRVLAFGFFFFCEKKPRQISVRLRICVSYRGSL